MMAEAVRPKKKSKQTGKCQDKNLAQSEGIKQAGKSGPTDREKDRALESLHEDVESLDPKIRKESTSQCTDVFVTFSSFSNELPASEQKYSSHTEHDFCSNGKEQDKFKSTENDVTCDCFSRKDTQQTKDSIEDQQLWPTDMDKIKHKLSGLDSVSCDKKALDCSLSPLKSYVSVLNPTANTQLIESQLFSVKDKNPVGLEVSETSSIQDKISHELCNFEEKPPAVLPLADQELPPSSLVPLHPLGLQKVQQKLYPDLSELWSDEELGNEQLKMWDPTTYLKNVEIHIVEFEGIAHQEGHELHELLQQYWRSCQQLCQAQAKLQAANSECRSTQNRLWSFRDEQLTIQGVCGDQTKVCGYHSFQQAVLNEAVLAELQHQFETKTDLMHQTVAMHTYTTMLSRLQVESYLYHMLSKNLITLNVAVDESISDFPDLMAQPSSIYPLKESISILFSFTRKILEDKQFQDDVHLWLRKLVAVLHRVGSCGDHLYLLNHLLRCPSGVGEWAVSFLQVEVLDDLSGMYHFMQALAILMSPVRNRADFLCHLRPCESKINSSCNLGPGSGNWTLVDEGGEEEEDSETSWLLLSEDDLISFFSQFPFDDLFKHLLGMTQKGGYNPQATTSHEVMKAFVFTSCLVEVLAFGLQTYNRARYRRFVKRIGHTIRMALCYVSDHWAQYKSLTEVTKTTVQQQPISIEKLQGEFDQLFFRTVLHVLRAKRLGIWLFMSEMPYGTLSSAMLWKIYYIMQCAETANPDGLCSDLNTNTCDVLTESKYQDEFEYWLSEMNSSDGICLLTTLARMAEPKHSNADPEFVCTVVLKIYKVSYVSMATRESFSKVGRELLAAIATTHPSMISVVVERLQETIDKVGMVSLYLFKELPLHLWKPTSNDLRIIHSWLLDYSLLTVENKLACIILERLNWGFLEDGCLALEPSLHTQVSLLVVEAYQKHLTDKPYGGIVSEGIKQVSYLANIVRLGCTPEASFSNWAWDLVLRLKLHMTEHSSQDSWTPKSLTNTLVPQLSDSPIMYPVLKAVKAGLPIGGYVAIAVTTIGHSLEKFCSEGLNLLWMLVNSQQLRAVVQILQNFLPLAYPYPCYLLNNAQFLRCIQLFLQLESGTSQGMAQQVTQKVTQHLTRTLYGEHVKLLNSIIQAHVSESCKAGRIGPTAVLEFWVQILTGQEFWYREKLVLFIMDHLCRAAVLHKQEECIQKLLYQQHKKALGYHGDRGLWSSLVGWFVAGNVTPSFIEGPALTQEVWFAWLTLNMEAIFEEDSQLRLCIEHELLSNPTLSPEQALKKAQAHLKLPVVPSLERMMIYRWAHQALATPADHPLLPLVWQKFLQLYLRQPGPEFGLETKGCIGRRFFQNSVHIALLKELKHRLLQVSDFHHAASKALKIPPCSNKEDLALQFPCMQYKTSPELHTELVRLFNVFMVWLEDEKLQRQEVYLPSLPTQYDPHRLARVMQNQQEVWTEFVDMERVQHELKETLQLCKKVRAEPLQNNSNSVFTDFFNPKTAQERILMNLRKHKQPEPALEIVPMRPPVPDISSCSLSDETLSSKLLQDDINKLQHQAKLAVLRETQQVALDSELLDLLPQLYSNHEDQITMQLECRGNGGHPCQGPALVTVTFEGMHRLDPVHNQIQSLNSDIRQLQIEATNCPPHCVTEAAVHAERFITALVNGFKVLPSHAIQKVGVAAFYHLVSSVCEDTQRYPPTRQFFSSCIEVLGQVFIQGVQSECKRLLKTILLNQHLCTLLSPYFTPNASPEELVDMYGEVVRALHTENGDITFMLLTKFDIAQWLVLAQPSFSDRSRLVEVVHLALSFCGMEPDSEVLMPFNLFCNHWAQLLCYQFPDHYNDCLRLLIQSSSDQLISQECWRAFLQVLGCSPLSKINTSKILGSALLLDSICLSPQQAEETIEWLSSFFMKLRLSKPDFHSFGLYCKWGPYIEQIKIFLAYLVNCIVDTKVRECAKEPPGSNVVVKVVFDLDSKIITLFKPWILVEDSSTGGPRSYPWLETDNNAAAKLVDLYSQLIYSLHDKFKSLLQFQHRGALWLHLMHYCDTCTAPKIPDYLLSTYHSTYRSLPWGELYPDQTLMNKFFNVERGSPKNCFLFLGEVLCKVNWVSVLKDALRPQPSPGDLTMVIYLFYMIVFLAKEEHLLLMSESPLLNLLGQSSIFPWYFVDLSSYHNVIGYVNTHYSPTLILHKNDSSKQILSLLQVSAGFGPATNGSQCKDMSLKCQSFIRLMVKFLTSLDQNGEISLPSMECEFEKLLECIVRFNPSETDLQQRHTATSSLFAELLTLLNSTDISTAKGLGARVHSWVMKRADTHLALALLTASCHSLASVRHMAHTTEACILAYFADVSRMNHFSGWGPVLASMTVPELTVHEFVEESLAMGSFLTLYTYILQKLNLEQTLLNEQKTLALLNTWISQVLPSGPTDEPKLFLWWHKALQLTLLQLELAQGCGLESCLLNLQSRMAQLGDERLSSGLLGAIGLGRKSPLSNRFRVVARSMSAFLLTQVPSESQVRITSEMDLQVSAKAQQALAVLESMSESKQYSEFKETLHQTCQFIRYPGHCLQHWNHLLALLVNSLYIDVHYLDILRD